jgi:hypothetical protein
LVAPGSGQSDHEAAVVADRAGHLFFMWMALDRRPYLAVSRDHGSSWSAPLMVGPPGLNEAWGPSLAIDDAGHVSLAYMGTMNSPGAPWTADYTKVTWTGYLALIEHPLDARPLIYSAPASPPSHPLALGTCGPDRCNNGVLDFIDNEFGPDGSAWGAFVDTGPHGNNMLMAARLYPPPASAASSQAPARVLPNTTGFEFTRWSPVVAAVALALLMLLLAGRRSRRRTG